VNCGWLFTVEMLAGDADGARWDIADERGGVPDYHRRAGLVVEGLEVTTKVGAGDTCSSRVRVGSPTPVGSSEPLDDAGLPGLVTDINAYRVALRTIKDRLPRIFAAAEPW
jgi:hypothetical protein